MNLSDNARTVLEARYLKKKPDGTKETPEEMFRRVADNIASAEEIYSSNVNIEDMAECFYQSMINMNFLPNSPTLMNAGRELQQLSGCFVLPIEDSMESIFDAVKNTALIHKSGGGTGFSFSRLRPKNSIVKTTEGVASGAVSFMTVFNATTEVIKQGGARRGANLGSLRVDHPDILEFITAKDNQNNLNNFNISVCVTDEFMKALADKSDYNLINPHTKSYAGTLSAEKVFYLICKQAWKNGEPAILFIDEINRHNTTPYVGTIETTNPCGEQPLLPYESCNLGSINLSNMLLPDCSDFSFSKIYNTVRLAVRFLDNVIDMNKYPTEEIKQTTLNNRKIGLGIMGWADALIKLGIPYSSDRATNIAYKLMREINRIAHKESEHLAEERGCFNNFIASTYQKKIRNATVTTIAPTGTLSIIANCSSGIEPVFSLAYWRNILDNTSMLEIHPILKDKLEKCFGYNHGWIKDIEKHGSLQNIEYIPDEIKKVFLTAHDLTPEQHVNMQSAFQKHTDNAVSKTVNLPNNASIGDVKNVFIKAYQSGCKGITVYRDGSRDKQVLSSTNKKNVCPDCNSTLEYIEGCVTCKQCGYSECL